MFILANLKNFTFAHEVIVLNDENNVMDFRKSSMKNIEENILELCSKYNCWNVRLLGSQTYAKKISAKLQAISLSKYDAKINVSIITKQ